MVYARVGVLTPKETQNVLALKLSGAVSAKFPQGSNWKTDKPRKLTRPFLKAAEDPNHSEGFCITPWDYTLGLHPCEMTHNGSR